LTDQDLAAAHNQGCRHKAQGGAVGTGAGVWLGVSHTFSVNAIKELPYQGAGPVLAACKAMCPRRVWQELKQMQQASPRSAESACQRSIALYSPPTIAPTPSAAAGRK
jgi:hypothetical protein